MKDLIRPEEVARNVLWECGLDDPTEIPLEQIIKSRGAYYEEIPLNGKDGEIISLSNGCFITVNSLIPYVTRKRFAAAHELGHYEMHRHIMPILSDTEEELLNWYQGGPHEKEANLFASEFLMPSIVFKTECTGRKFGPDVIEHLANRFSVSKTATMLKFVNIGNHPVFIVYCKNNQMIWWKKSEDFHHYSLFEYNSHPPTGTVAREIFEKGIAYYGAEAKQQIWKSDWFKMNDDEDDTPFFEYCLYAPTLNYTISIIWEK